MPEQMPVDLTCRARLSPQRLLIRAGVSAVRRMALRIVCAVAALGWLMPAIVTETRAAELGSLAGEWVQRAQFDLFYELDVLADGTFQLYPVHSYEGNLRETFYYNKLHLNLAGTLDGNELRGTVSKSLGNCRYRAPFVGRIRAGGRGLSFQWTAPACASLGASGAMTVELERP